jgi:hypothetical protein
MVCGSVFKDKIMFSTLKKKIQDQFASMCDGRNTLYSVTVDREKIWDLYLSGFEPEMRQEHNCNCCKSFLRQFSGIVVINKNNKVVSIWDIEVPEEFKKAVKNVADYIHSLPVSNVFVNSFANLGTDKNTQVKEGITPITWNHFYLSLDKKFVHRSSSSIDSVMGVHRDNKNVLKRSLDELTLEAADTILELIAQNSLYRGKEFEGMVTSFRTLKAKYDKIPVTEQDNFCWAQATDTGITVSRIRNTAIGTLLIDLSKGEDLDKSVSAFERVVAPTNYKRPTALVTPRMVDEAKKKVEELGLTESLERRYASPEDISVENLLYADRSSEITDVFDDIAKSTKVNPRTLTKVEEISIDDFLTNIVPTSKSIELLVENPHTNNMVALLTGEHKDAPSMFKWANPFSWSYTGGITDSMKERVKAAGGKVDGVLRFSIQWNEDGKSSIDLDAHAHEPNGQHIHFRNYKGHKTPQSGMLDVDMICPTGVGVENITWVNQSQMKPGVYRFRVHNYSGHRNFNGVRAEIEFDGQLYEFGTDKPFSDYLDVAEVTYSVANGFTVKSLIDTKSSISSKEKWGIDTNQFHKVKSIMLSPNYWNGKVGNKHYIFALEGCIPDEAPRPFFNEFLTDELTKDRKVFEILGSKVKVGKTTNPVSGIGFSETQRNHVFVKVQGTFKRTLKVNF